MFFERKRIEKRNIQEISEMDSRQYVNYKEFRIRMPKWSPVGDSVVEIGGATNFFYTISRNSRHFGVLQCA